MVRGFKSLGNARKSRRASGARDPVAVLLTSSLSGGDASGDPEPWSRRVIFLEVHAPSFTVAFLPFLWPLLLQSGLAIAHALCDFPDRDHALAHVVGVPGMARVSPEERRKPTPFDEVRQAGGVTEPNAFHDCLSTPVMRHRKYFLAQCGSRDGSSPVEGWAVAPLP